MVQLLLLWLFFFLSSRLSQYQLLFHQPELEQSTLLKLRHVDWITANTAVTHLAYICSVAHLHRLTSLRGWITITVGGLTYIWVELCSPGNSAGALVAQRGALLHLLYTVVFHGSGTTTGSPPPLSHFLAYHPVSLLFRQETLNWPVNRPCVDKEFDFHWLMPSSFKQNMSDGSKNLVIAVLSMKIQVESDLGSRWQWADPKG